MLSVCKFTCLPRSSFILSIGQLRGGRTHRVAATETVFPISDCFNKRPLKMPRIELGTFGIPQYHDNCDPSSPHLAFTSLCCLLHCRPEIAISLGAGTFVLCLPLCKALCAPINATWINQLPKALTCFPKVRCREPYQKAPSTSKSQTKPGFIYHIFMSPNLSAYRLSSKAKVSMPCQCLFPPNKPQKFTQSRDCLSHL